MIAMTEILFRVSAAILAEGGRVTEVKTTGGNHRKVSFTVNGKTGVVFIPGTPRHGADINMITTARRVVRKVKGTAA